MFEISKSAEPQLILLDQLFQEIVLAISFDSLKRGCSCSDQPLDCPACDQGREFDLQVSIIKSYLLKSPSAGADRTELPYGSC